MLNILNKKLTNSDDKILSSDSILYLKADIDCTFIGVLKFISGEQKILNFVKTNDVYQARLIITEDDIRKLSTSKFFVAMISGSMTQQTNTIEFEFDIELIKQSIKIVRSEEVLELRKQIAELENKVDSFTKGEILKGINIKNIGLIAKGMVPVAIDDKGNFVAMYPFQDFLSEINGQKAANGSVVIDSSMINYIRGKTIENELSDQSDAIISINNSLITLSEEVKKLSKRIADVEIKLERHIANGII